MSSPKDSGADAGYARATPPATLRDRVLGFVRRSRRIHHCALWASEVHKRFRPVRGRRNRIDNAGVLLGARFDIEGNDNRLSIGRGSVLHGTRIYLRGHRHVLEVGECCHLKGGTLWFEDEGCLIRIGSRSAFGDVHIAATEPGRQVIIGVGCLFSSDIDIRTGDSHSIIDVTSGMRLNPATDVTIGSRVWIGAHVRVLKGATIGEGSIIGTGSLVTGSIGHHCLAAGVPARVLRANVTWRRERL